MILHVVDCSNPQMDMQMHVVYETLRQLEITDKEIVTVFNKIDREGADTAGRDMAADYRVKISAKTGEGLPDLLGVLETILRSRRIYFEKGVLLCRGRADPADPEKRPPPVRGI